MSSCTKVFWLALLVPACFDVEQRDQRTEQALLLGDFEGGNYLAPFPFEKWSTVFFNPAGDVPYPDGSVRSITQEIEFVPSRSGAGQALMVDVDFRPSNNQQDSGGGVTVKVDRTTTADLNQYRAIEFYAKLEIVGEPLANQNPYVQLGCTAAPAIDPSSKPELLTSAYIPGLSNDWIKFDLQLSEFDDPNYNGYQIAGDATDRGRECRAVVDEVRFVISARASPDGETSALIYVDDVRLH